MKPRSTISAAFAVVILLSLNGPAQAQIPGVGARPATTNPTAIVGSVADSSGRALAGAAVTVKTATDQATLTGAMTDSKGKFRIEGLAPAKYHLHFSYIGYKVHEQNVEVASAGSVVNVGIVRLATDVIAVSGITAQAMRSAMTVGVDRNIYSTKNMPAASGGTTTELLRNIPELDVDVDGNVKLQGSQSVALHINGRPAPMRGDALKNFLQMLPANRVERVEIVPNPSAKYDPEGIAGIVNIVLKDNMDLGTSGNLSLNADSKGRHSIGAGLNYQKGQLTLFGNGSFNLNNQDVRLFDRRENLLANPRTYFTNSVNTNQGGHIVFFDGSAEYRLTKLNTLYASARVMNANVDMDGTQANELLNASQVVLSSWRWNNANTYSAGNSDASLGLRRIVKAQQNELTGELRYVGTPLDLTQDYVRQLLIPTTPTLPNESGETVSNTGVGEYSAKLDYTRQLNPKVKLDAGFKGALRSTDYTNVLERFAGTATTPFSEQHSDYNYDENYQQAYGLLSRQFGKVGVQVGARAELAYTSFQVPNGDSFDNHYNNLFPSLNVSYVKNQGFSARFSYSRRVDRPQPSMLNPGQPSADSMNRFVGNPNLEPKYSHALTADFTHMASWGMLKVSPYYRLTTNNWDYFKFVDSLGVATLTWLNTSSVKSYGTNATVNLRWGAKASGFVSFNAYEFKRDASNLNGSYSGDGFRWDVSVNGMGTLRKGLLVQSFVRYTAPQDMPQGSIKQGVISTLALRQQMKGTKMSVYAAVIDPFNVFTFKFETRDATHIQTSHNEISIRGARVGFTYNFGKPPTPTVRKEEQQQVETQPPQIR